MGGSGENRQTESEVEVAMPEAATVDAGHPLKFKQLQYEHGTVLVCLSSHTTLVVSYLMAGTTVNAFVVFSSTASSLAARRKHANTSGKLSATTGLQSAPGAHISRI